MGDLWEGRVVDAAGESWWIRTGAEADRSGPDFFWWAGPWSSGGSCFACSWSAATLVRVVQARLGWSRDLVACKRHGYPPRWRHRVWSRARPLAVLDA